jgi:hypothetical protein
MTLNDKDRDVDLELAEQLVARSRENSRRNCACLELPELPPRADDSPPQEEEDTWPTGFSLWYLVSPGLLLWILRDEVSWVTASALSVFRGFVLGWLGFPGAG